MNETKEQWMRWIDQIKVLILNGIGPSSKEIRYEGDKNEEKCEFAYTLLYSW